MLTDFEEHAEIVPVGILLHHVDIRAGLNSLVEANRVVTADHSVNFHLLVDASQVFLANVCNFNYFASIDLLRWVHSRPHCLLLRPFDVLEEVRRELGFANFTVLAFSEDIVHKNDEVVDFAHLRLFGGASHVVCIRSPSSVLVVPLRGEGAPSIVRPVIHWDSLRRA